MTHWDRLGLVRNFFFKDTYSFTHKQLCARKLSHVPQWKKLCHVSPYSGVQFNSTNIFNPSCVKTLTEKHLLRGWGSYHSPNHSPRFSDSQVHEFPCWQEGIRVDARVSWLYSSLLGSWEHSVSTSAVVGSTHAFLETLVILCSYISMKIAISKWLTNLKLHAGA